MAQFDFDQQFELDLLICGDLQVDEAMQVVTFYLGRGQTSYDFLNRRYVHSSPEQNFVRALKIKRSWQDVYDLLKYSGI